MRAVERVLRNQDERKRRLDEAKGAESKLTPDEREEFAAYLIAKLEAQEPREPQHVSPPEDLWDDASSPPRRAHHAHSTPAKRKRAASTSKVAKGNKTDAAEAYVLASTEGVSTGDVAIHIHQSMRTADSTLRQLMAKRGTIVRRARLWYPAESAEKKTASRKPTNRHAITVALSKSGETGLAGIFHGVKAILPDAQYGSVASEVMRMRKAGLIVATGQGPHGRLYGLANGGAGAATAN